MVSVIIPVRNEEAFIANTLRSVLAQDYPGERLEVLVVDGMSDDRTTDVVLKIAEQDSRVRLLQNRSRIMASGFNHGLVEAQGDVIVMMGGHAEMAPNYVSTCARALQQGIADCAGAPIETIARDTRGAAISQAMSSRFGVGSAFRCGCDKPRYVDTVAFGAYTRAIIEQAGGLDEEFVRNQDDEFNYRLRKLGARILLLPGTHCRYTARGSLRTLGKQFFDYGLWKVRVMQKHPSQMQVRHFVPAVFVFVLGVSMLTAPFSALSRAILLLALGCYAATNLFVSLWLTCQARVWGRMAVLPLVFLVLHFSYGLGFLAGLIHFSNRWNRPGPTGGLRSSGSDPK
jgi:succinoglycan biosynthesis protein ExoA